MSSKSYQSSGAGSAQADTISKVVIYNGPKGGADVSERFRAEYEDARQVLDTTCPDLSARLRRHYHLDENWLRPLLLGLGPTSMERLMACGGLPLCLAVATLRHALRCGSDDSGRQELPGEVDRLLASCRARLTAEDVREWVSADPFAPLARTTRDIRIGVKSGGREDPTVGDTLAMLSFGALAMFFTDLYALLTQYRPEYQSWIEYGTNAKLDLRDFQGHILGPVELRAESTYDTRRVDIRLSCDNADVHKAVALFVKRFERELEGFESLFQAVEAKIYYIRPNIQAKRNDGVSNYNFEAYTPTLMPLLAGGHMYSTPLVFARELIQNSMDAIQSRIHGDRGYELTPSERTIRIELECETELVALKKVAGKGFVPRTKVTTFTIVDQGTGMSRNDVDRYLTSIGRSFYTSQEYRKLELDYEPLSTYGIGFLSCFLVGDNVTVRTHKQDVSSESIELTVPNVEGCFFVEAVEPDLPIGTSVVVHVAEERPVYLTELLEYIGDTVQDIPFDVVVSWNGPALTRYRVVDASKRPLPMYNTDIRALARSQAIPPRAEHAFVQGTILVNDEDEDYRKLWWNKYLRGKLGGAELEQVATSVGGLMYPRHYARSLGSAFRLHVPLSDKAPQDYGIDITDVPGAGHRLRGHEQGERPISGKQMVLNAGVLVERGSLRDVFGQDMFILTLDTETAYNNVFVNFPPSLVNLSIGRDAINGLAPGVNVNDVIRRMVSGALAEINAIMESDCDCPLVHVHEAATFFEVMSRRINLSDATEEAKRLYSEITRKELYLYVRTTPDGMRFRVEEGNEGKREIRSVFTPELERHRPIGVSEQARDEFVRRYVAAYSDVNKKIALEEMDALLARSFLPGGDALAASDPSGSAPLSFQLFSAYLLAIDGTNRNVKKATEIRLAIAKQVFRAYTVADYRRGRLSVTVPWHTVEQVAALLFVRGDS